MRGHYDNSLSLQERGTGAQRQGEGKHHSISCKQRKRSQELRHDQTQAEAYLRERLRAKRLQGLKFKRQVPIGPYIADFVCRQAKLIVELDGSQHADAADYDERRTRFLQDQGYQVLRFWNNDVLERTEAVLEVILAAAAGPLPGVSRLSLSPEGERATSLLPQGRGDARAVSRGEGS